MPTQNISSLRAKVLLPLGAAAAVIGLLLTAAVPAQAASWSGRTETGTNSHGTWATAALSTNWDYGSSYYMHFNPYGEMLTLTDAMSDGHAARGEVLVYNHNGDLVDRDTFYKGTADSDDAMNIGSPDGSGDIPENYSVWMRLCINELDICTSYVKGIA